MISGNIALDKLISDIDQQLEILQVIAADSAVLNEQLRLLNESRDLLLSMDLEMHRLTEFIDPDFQGEQLTLMQQREDD